MRRSRRRVWLFLSSALAAALVLAAAAMSLFQIAVEALPGYRHDLEQKISQAAGHPAHIAGLALGWRGFEPTLSLRGIELYDGPVTAPIPATVAATASAPVLRIDELRLGFGLWRLLRGERTPLRAELRGLELHADVDAGGSMRLRGFELSAAAPASRGDAAATLQKLKWLRLADGRLHVHDPLQGAAPLDFWLRRAEVEHRGADFFLRAELDPPAPVAAHAELHGDLHGDLAHRETLSGAARLEVRELRGWPWARHWLAADASISLRDAGVQLAARIERGQVSQFELSAQAAQFAALRKEQPLAELAQFRLEAQAHSIASGWQAELGRLEWIGARGAWSAGRGQLTSTRSAAGLGFEAALARLRLDDFAPWLALWKDLPPAAARVTDLRGDLTELHLSGLPPDAADGGEPRERLRFAASLVGVGLAAAGDQDGVSGLEGSMVADHDGGTLRLERNSLRISLPAIFAEPLPIDAFSSTLGWRREGDDWHLWSDAFDWRALGTQGAGRFDLRLADDGQRHSPRLSVSADFSGTGIDPLKPFIPLDWSPHTREWLARALVAGHVPKASLMLDGSLADYPFDHGEGRWGLDLQIADAKLAFAPDWPPLEHLQGRFKLRGHGMRVEAERGTLGGNRVGPVVAAITDFRDPRLTVDGTVRGDIARFYEVLRASPLHAQLAGLVDKTDAGGAAQLELHLDFALAAEPMETHVNGSVALDSVRLAIHGLEEPVRELSGSIGFGAAGLSAEALQARFYGQPLTARIRAEAGVPNGVIEAQTPLPLAQTDGLAAAYLPQWLRRRLSGATTLHAQLPLGGADEGKLRLSTDLSGVSSRLPPPLAKTAETSLPLRADIGEAQNTLRLDIAISDVMRIALRFGETRASQTLRAAEVRLDGGAPPRAEADGIVVSGSPAELDLAPWLVFVGDHGPDTGSRDAGSGDVGGADANAGATSSAPQAAPGEAPAFVSADLRPGRLFYGDAVLLQPHLHAVRAGSGYRVDFDGASAQGRIEWSPDERGHVVARLQRLGFEPFPAGAPAEHQDAKPSPESSSESSPQAPSFAPDAAPTLDLEVQALTVGDAALGHLTLTSSRIADGQQLDLLRLEGGDAQLEASGAWRRAAGLSSAELGFSIDAEHIGSVLKAFGFASTLSAKQSKFSASLAWAPDARGLALAQAQGTLALDLHKGDLKSVEPGAGRVLGLLNIYALPRRLLLDFRDVAGKGLGFDKASGHFALGGGEARSDDLEIQSPSLKIEVRGRVGLAARDYDEHVTVYPDVTTGVTAGAALAGGPVGALIALVAQEALGKPFNKLAKFSYRVTGPWDNPQIERGKGSGKDEHAPAPESPATPEEEPPPQSQADSP